jgi:hypothetical protein
MDEPIEDTNDIEASHHNGNDAIVPALAGSNFGVADAALSMQVGVSDAFIDIDEVDGDGAIDMISVCAPRLFV